jgi:predicted anti-sigma-YlaC factor YlaD
MKGERTVAGVRCGEVLEALPDYLEGALPAVERDRVESHLRGCDLCERFGGEYATTVSALRRVLGNAAALPEGMTDRLRARIAGVDPVGPRDH